MADLKESWVPFTGGELEGRRPGGSRPLCRRCRARFDSRRIGTEAVPLCFQCYRAGLDRDRTLQDAANLDTASHERFQYLLPFEPVNRQRLTMLRAERQAARASERAGSSFDARRRAAQMNARRALARIDVALEKRGASTLERHRAMASAFYAAELQFPDAWLPFVVSR
jgi:hypothetical protein